MSRRAKCKGRPVRGEYVTNSVLLPMCSRKSLKKKDQNMKGGVGEERRGEERGGEEGGGGERGGREEWEGGGSVPR